MPKHWTTTEVAAKLADGGLVSITLAEDDSAPDYSSTTRRIYGPGYVSYYRNATGGITTQAGDGARSL